MRSRHILLSCVMLTLVGCSTQRPPSQSDTQANEAEKSSVSVDGPLRVLVLDDPDFASVLEREWSARSEHDVRFRNDSEAELLSQLRSDRPSLDPDVIIFPGRLLGELAENRLLRALPPELTSTSTEAAVAGYNLADVFPAIARKEMQWDRRQVAVSLGSPAAMLLVRTDLVATIPTTWPELSEAIGELRRSLPADMQPLVQPLAQGWAARMFLSRSAAYLYQPSRVSSFFDYTSLKPRIDLEPCVRALREMVAEHSQGDQSLNPKTAFEAFLTGKAAMAITWPQQTKVPFDASAFPISVYELPGSAMEYDQRRQEWKSLSDPHAVRRVTVLGHEGRMAVIPRSAKNANLAAIFLGWLGGPEQSAQLSPRSISSAPFRLSHRSSYENWCGDRLSAATVSQYAMNIEAALSRPEAYVSLRIPGQDQYMNVLDECVLRALKGEVTPKAALEQAAERWEAITDQLGRDKQITAYRHSLGIDLE